MLQDCDRCGESHVRLRGIPPLCESCIDAIDEAEPRGAVVTSRGTTRAAAASGTFHHDDDVGALIRAARPW